MDDPETPRPEAVGDDSSGEPGRQDERLGDPRESAYELLQRGTALLAKRHPAQAAVVLQRAAGLEQGKGSILEPLGRAYFMSGQLDRAIETFTTLLEVDPTSHFAHYALGRSLARLGRPVEARTHLRLALALSPSSRLYRGALQRIEGIGHPGGRESEPPGFEPPGFVPPGVEPPSAEPRRG